ncbi:MAG: hypothetical protein CMB80_02905 [Flammeovirgaceae bacterium]|nr:hypothetical protein [Flammeovirgaceae bacterium]
MPKEKKIQDEIIDPLALFRLPVEEMTREECESTLLKLRKQRQVRISSTKKKDALDLALNSMTQEAAKKLLDQIAEQEEKEKEKEKEKEDKT